MSLSRWASRFPEHLSAICHSLLSSKQAPSPSTLHHQVSPVTRYAAERPTLSRRLESTFPSIGHHRRVKQNSQGFKQEESLGGKESTYERITIQLSRLGKLWTNSLFGAMPLCYGFFIRVQSDCNCLWSSTLPCMTNEKLHTQYSWSIDRQCVTLIENWGALAGDPQLQVSRFHFIGLCSPQQTKRAAAWVAVQ